MDYLVPAATADPFRALLGIPAAYVVVVAVRWIMFAR